MKVKVLMVGQNCLSILEREACPEGYTCLNSYRETAREAGEGGLMVTLEIQTVPEFWREEFCRERVKLPGKYLLEKWWHYGPSMGHTETLIDTVSIPVNVRSRISGGGPFIYNGLFGVNTGLPREKRFISFAWEVNELEISFSGKEFGQTYDFHIKMPAAPREIGSVRMAGITQPSAPAPLSKRLFDAKRKLFQEAGACCLAQEWPAQEAAVTACYQVEAEAYEQKLAEYDRLLAIAESERGERVARWKKEQGLEEISELACLIEAEIKRRFGNG